MARNYDYNGDPCGEFGTALREVNKLQDEIARLRLTDEERTAIGLARSVFEDYKMSRLHSAADEVLERLLERTK
jgi:hypothetical protein